MRLPNEMHLPKTMSSPREMHSLKEMHLPRDIRLAIKCVHQEKFAHHHILPRKMRSTKTVGLPENCVHPEIFI